VSGPNVSGAANFGGASRGPNVDGAADVGSSVSGPDVEGAANAGSSARGPDVGGAANAGSSAGGPNVGGAANVGSNLSAGGGANAGGATSAGSRVEGGASSGSSSAMNVGASAGGSASTSVGAASTSATAVGSGAAFDSGGDDLDGSTAVELPDGDVVGDAAGSVRDAQSTGASGNVEGEIYGEVGPDGKSIAKGGAAGMGENAVDGELDIGAEERKAKHAGHTQGLAGRKSVDGSVEGAAGTSGYRNPEAEVGRAHQLELNERDRAMGQVSHAQDTKADAGAAIKDPSGSAQRAARDGGMREAAHRAPVSAGDVQADANVASDTVKNPATAGEANLGVKVDAQVRPVDPPKKK
jgi:hypothetical protein